jgi:hypothetical protein
MLFITNSAYIRTSYLISSTRSVTLTEGGGAGGARPSRRGGGPEKEKRREMEKAGQLYALFILV